MSSADDAKKDKEEIQFKQKNVDKPQGAIERAVDCPIIAADGYFFSVSPAGTSMIFFQDVDEWQFEAGTMMRTRVANVTRKIRVEVRLPTTMAHVMAAAVLAAAESIKDLPPGTKKIGMLDWDGADKS